MNLRIITRIISFVLGFFIGIVLGYWYVNFNGIYYHGTYLLPLFFKIILFPVTIFSYIFYGNDVPHGGDNGLGYGILAMLISALWCGFVGLFVSWFFTKK